MRWLKKINLTFRPFNFYKTTFVVFYLSTILAKKVCIPNFLFTLPTEVMADLNSDNYTW